MSDSPVLDAAMKWINKIDKKYGQGLEGFKKWNAEHADEDKHTIYPVGPYMKRVK